MSVPEPIKGGRFPFVARLSHADRLGNVRFQGDRKSCADRQNDAMTHDGHQAKPDRIAGPQSVDQAEDEKLKRKPRAAFV